jgi:hypothetical protein
LFNHTLSFDYSAHRTGLTRAAGLTRFQSLDLALILSLSFRSEHRGIAAVL